MGSRFADWIERQLEARSMTRADLADKMGVSPLEYALVMKEDPANQLFVTKVAWALEVPVMDAYQAAGLPHTLSLSVQTEQEWMLLWYFRELTDEERETVFEKAKGLAGQGG